MQTHVNESASGKQAKTCAKRNRKYMFLNERERVKDLDAILVPVGSGGLLAGITVAVKHAAPNVKVIGLESETCPTFMMAMKEGRPIVAKPLPSFADGLTVKIAGCNAFHTLK
ncbi:hypothetical protein OSTOST_02826, partial [Ostertagia ostertagi]